MIEALMFPSISALVPSLVRAFPRTMTFSHSCFQKRAENPGG